MQHLCEEISDLVQETGQASLADLSRNFNLPINFLMKVCYQLYCTTVWGGMSMLSTVVQYSSGLAVNLKALLY